MALRVESNERAPGASRSHLAAVRHLLGPRYDDALLVLSELVTNSVKHGPRGGAIDVSVSADGDVIRLEVTDCGTGFDMTRPRGDGLGLNIIDGVADRWGTIGDGGFTVWVELAKA